MPSYELSGQVAVVTGAGRGIGRAIAMRLAREGTAIVVADIDYETARSVSNAITSSGGRSIATDLDVGNRARVVATVEEAISAFGRLDIMVNNAGVLALAPALKVTEEDWDRHMSVNAKGVLFCSQVAASRMIAQGHGGRIITIVSTAGRLPSSGNTPASAYVASKHAAMGLIKQMAVELAPHDILMNAVFPGIVDTEMVRSLQAAISEQSGEPYAQVRERFRNLIPLGRYQEPEEVAAMVAFLASADAGSSVGQVFDLNGGIAFW